MTFDITTAMAIIITVEQVLAGCDSFKSNSTFQLICNVTNALVGFFKKTPAV